MNLIEESFQNKEEKKNKNISRIILVAIFLILMLIIGIVVYMVYLQNSMLKLTLDNVQNDKLKELLVFEEDGTIYIPIKEVASYFSYESFNGEYTDKSEEQSKCYVQCANEVANFTLGSNEIYKLDLSNADASYERIEIDKPVIAKGGKLYTTPEGIQEAFNVSFAYDQEKNRIYIYTMPYLIQSYASKVLDYGYAEISPVFGNQKTVLENILIVNKDKNSPKYGVIDVSGNVIIEAKYDNITYLSNTGDFLVETNKKVGIVSKTKETKVEIMYDSLELIDNEAGLYLASRDNKYGVIDLNGKIKIHIENDAIGIDSSKFKYNDIKNKYLIVDNLIPVKKDDLWAIYDKKGNQLTEFIYQSLGYETSNNKNALNLLIIPDYDVVVAKRSDKYTLINASGKELFKSPVADDIYMTISGGEKHYYINANDKTVDAEAYLDAQGISAKSNNSNQETSDTEDNNTTNETNTTNTTKKTNKNNETDEENESNEENKTTSSNTSEKNKNSRSEE